MGNLLETESLKKKLTVTQQPSTANSYSGTGGALWALFLSMQKIWTAWFYAGKHRGYKIMSVNSHVMSRESIPQHVPHPNPWPFCFLPPLPWRPWALWAAKLVNTSTVTYSQQCGQWRVSAWTTAHCIKKRLWPRLGVTIIYGMNFWQSWPELEGEVPRSLWLS